MKKITLGGWKSFYAFKNRCREAELWDWKTTLTLFGLLVTSDSLQLGTVGQQYI